MIKNLLNEDQIDALKKKLYEAIHDDPPVWHAWMDACPISDMIDMEDMNAALLTLEPSEYAAFREWWNAQPVSYYLSPEECEHHIALTNYEDGELEAEIEKLRQAA